MNDAAAPSAPLPAARSRLASLDIARGAVMVLMVIDHVRHYLSNAEFDPADMGKTWAALFFTKWVTHFCAPTFVFLAGTGAYLRGARDGDRPALAKFLLTRGIWLIFVEMTLVRFGWTFNLDYAHYLFGGVIAMIGGCMILMAPLVFLRTEIIAALGLAIIAGHNTLDFLLPPRMPALLQSPLLPLYQVLYLGGPVRLFGGTSVLHMLFTLVPWIGVMAAGYAFGAVMKMEPERRKRICLGLGLGAIALFLVVRGINVYGDKVPWSVQRRGGSITLLSFFNTRKYPASLSFLLMTLGPLLALIPFFERLEGKVAKVLVVFGRVPFLYYVLHLPLIHLIAMVLARVHYGTILPFFFGHHPMAAAPPPPAGYGYGLPVVYLITALVVALLYPPCRWMAGLKARRKDAWLSFL
jgi:uncharacterized membrane protein